MKKILIVDDDPFITSVYRNKFQSEGFDAEIASSGSAAIQMINKNSWDLIVLDLQLPDLNGVEVLKSIRASDSAGKTPVIVFSNAFLSSLVESAWKAGANQLLTKAQCTPNQLVGAVRHILEAAPPPLLKSNHVSIAVPGAIPPPPQEPDTRDRPQRHEDDDPQAEFRHRFHDNLPLATTELRERVRDFLNGRDEQIRRETLGVLGRKVHAMIGVASAAGYGRVAQMASALEALFHELYDRPRTVNISTLRTIVHGVDALLSCCRATNEDAPSTSLPPLALVVDDDDVSGIAVSSALEQVSVRSVVVNNPLTALDLCHRNRFELALLDVNMPGMDGFTLCKRIRSFPDVEAPRVIFVTSLTDFRAVARDLVRDDEEVIAKPFAPMELAVKALTALFVSPGPGILQDSEEKCCQK